MRYRSRPSSPATTSRRHRLAGAARPREQDVDTRAERQPRAEAPFVEHEPPVLDAPADLDELALAVRRKDEVVETEYRLDAPGLLAELSAGLRPCRGEERAVEVQTGAGSDARSGRDLQRRQLEPLRERRRERWIEIDVGRGERTPPRGTAPPERRRPEVNRRDVAQLAVGRPPLGRSREDHDAGMPGDGAEEAARCGVAPPRRDGVRARDVDEPAAQASLEQRMTQQPVQNVLVHVGTAQVERQQRRVRRARKEPRSGVPSRAVDPAEIEPERNRRGGGLPHGPSDRARAGAGSVANASGGGGRQENRREAQRGPAPPGRSRTRAGRARARATEAADRPRRVGHEFEQPRLHQRARRCATCRRRSSFSAASRRGGSARGPATGAVRVTSSCRIA